MSHAATNWAIQRRGLPPITKILLWHLADCHNPVAGCFPTQEYLADQCEISRASVNRHLSDLEESGLIRREQVVDTVSKRQRPTRYFLAFEEGFSPLDIVSRVSTSDTEAVSQNSPSRVSENAIAVSQSSETLTCKGTSKEPMEAEAFFDRVIEKFPHRPGTSMIEARKALGTIDPSDWELLERGVERYRAGFEEERLARGESAEERSRFSPFIANWIDSGKWREAGALLVNATEPQRRALTRLHRDRDAKLWLECERLLGKEAPTSGLEWSFAADVVEAARQALKTAA